MFNNKQIKYNWVKFVATYNDQFSVIMYVTFVLQMVFEMIYE